MKSLSKADSAALADPVSTLTRRVQGQLTGRLKACLKDSYIKRVYCQGKLRIRRLRPYHASTDMNRHAMIPRFRHSAKLQAGVCAERQVGLRPRPAGR